MQVEHGLYTANVRANTRAVQDLIEATPGLTAVVLNLDRLEATTITVLDALADLDRQLAASGVALHVAALPARARAVAERVDWYQRLDAAGRVHPNAAAGLDVAAARGPAGQRPEMR